MRSTDPFRLALGGLAVVAALAAAAGTPVRATYGAQTAADEPQYLLTAISIAEDGDVDIADELSQQRWRAFHESQLPEQTRPLAGGRRVSPHDPLLPLLLAPAMAAGGWVAAKLVLALFAGLLAAVTAWTAVRRFGAPPTVAIAVTMVFAASVPLAAYGTQVYPEIPAALATVTAVAALTGPLQRRGCWVATAAVVALPWLAIKYAPVAAVLAMVALARLHRSGRRGAALGMLTALVASGVVFVGVHLLVWEGFTAYASGDHFVGGEFTAVGASPNYPGRARRLIGLLIDREFGLAAWQPAWLLGVPALALLARRPPAFWHTLWVPLAVGWLNATFVALTMHGYWFPGRQVVVVLPLLVIAMAIVAGRSRPFLIATVAGGVIGLWSYAWLVLAGVAGSITWVTDFFTVADPWYRVWSSTLPAYRTVGPGDWLRHGVWLCVAAAAVLLALGLHRRAGPRARLRARRAGPGRARPGT